MAINEVTYHSWLIRTQPQITSPSKYVNKIKWLSEQLKDNGYTHIELFSIDSVGLIKELKETYFSNTTKREKHTRGFFMHKRGFELYEQFLNETYGNESITDDILKIQLENELSETERKTYSLGRIGQGLYRRKLVDYWKKCAVTGFDEIPLLIASHIKPWKDSNNFEKLDVFNGLLLTPNLDKVFDLGLITFNIKGKIILSEFLDSFDSLGVSENMEIDIDLRHQPYLKYHRENIFKSNKT